MHNTQLNSGVELLLLMAKILEIRAIIRIAFILATVIDMEVIETKASFLAVWAINT